MRNQKGITLVALVVTIVVLLILAGTSIAMLSGDNGIITNAQKSAAANTEGTVAENMKNAYNAIKTEIIAKASTSSSYDATVIGTEADLLVKLVEELGLTPNNALKPADEDTPVATIPENLLASTDPEDGHTVAYDSSTHKVTITYTDSTFQNGKTVAGVTMGTIKSEFTIESANLSSITWTPTTPYFISNY